MTGDVAGLLRSVREALEVGGDRLDPGAVTSARGVLDRAGERLELGADRTVVALAGATGSGKSSLFNALAGLELARVGVRRPTTSLPAACVWGGGADALLEWLDVPRRHRTARESALDAGEQDDLRGLVLLDLPDHDSTQVAHRLEVDRMVARVDLLVWVVDPQKYADDALHEHYLRRLAGHEAVLLVVLNQVDTLAPGAVEKVREDLQRLLRADGLDGVRVLTTSARTGEGVPDLRANLADAVRSRSVAVERIAADLADVTTQLVAGVGHTEPDPDRIAGAETLVTALAGAAGVPAVLDAVAADYRRGAHGAVGWPLTRWMRAFRPDPLKRLRLGTAGEEALGQLRRSSLPEATHAQRAQVELAGRRVAESAADGLPQRWVDAVRQATAPAGSDLTDALDRAVTGVPLERRRPAWWSVLGALQILFTVAAIAGALWLLGLFVIGWLRLPEPPTPEIEGLPWPTVLLAGGLLTGLLIALVGGRLARWGARRRRRRTEKRMREAIAVVARERVLDPVAAVLRDHRRTREALARR